MSTYIVTGGSGRLGASVVAVLVEAGHTVYSVDRVLVDDLPCAQIEHDLLEAEATIELFTGLKPDGVIHLAAISIPFSAPEHVIFATNAALAINVLEATVASGATSLLTASSPTVIGYGAPGGWKPEYLPIDEAHPVAPWNAYALSKHMVEEIVAMAVRQYGDVARFGVFRPCFVIAPEEWQGAPTQQGHTVRERLDDPALSAVALFNYLDARDAGEFVLAWLERAGSIPNGSCFFVGAADSLATGRVSDLLAEHIPSTAAAAAGLPDDAPVFSSALAEKLLGWRARRTWRTELDSSEASIV